MEDEEKYESVSVTAPSFGECVLLRQVSFERCRKITFYFKQNHLVCDGRKALLNTAQTTSYDICCWNSVAHEIAFGEIGEMDEILLFKKYFFPKKRQPVLLYLNCFQSNL